MFRSRTERVGHTKSSFTGMLVAQKQSILAGAMAGTMLISLCLPLGIIAAETATPNLSDNSTSVTAGEVDNAIANVDGLEEASDDVAVTSDEDSALKTATAGATIDVPKDASEGVTLDSDDPNVPSLDIGLPNADQAQDAKQVETGIVAYAGTDGSANAVQATEDGGVRMLTIIDRPDAPTEYDYKITVPNGGSIELTEEGGALVLDNQEEVIANVATPWAKDAEDKQIDTWFTTDGQTLTQHVEHNVPGVVYPVTADPQVGFGWFIYMRLSPQDQSFIIQATPSVAGAFACGAITKNPRVAVSCTALGGLVKDWIGVYYKPKKWLEIKFTYTGFWAGAKTL